MKRKQKGFTLIELIVVIAIIGVLAAILVPTMLGYVKKSKRASDVSNAREMHTSVLDLVLEDDEANDSFYEQASNYSASIKKTDAISHTDYDLVLVAYLDGAAGSDGSGKVWTEMDSAQKTFCDKLNKRLGYAAGSSAIKLKINSKADKSTEKYNRWFVGYRKDTPTTVEVWIGDGSSGAGGDPQMCLYTQINKVHD